MTTYVAGQALEVNPNDTRVQADIGINPWEGDNFALGDGAERQVVPVMPLVRDYIVQQKKIATANVAADQVLASLKNTWTEFDAATTSARERYAAERAQIAAERRFTPPAGSATVDEAGNVVEGPTAPAHRALGVRDDVATERARAEITQALATQLEAKLKALAEAEQTARAELDNPVPASAEDMEAALDLQVSLGLLTPQYAVPILLRQLVIDPARTGKGQGKVTALLPIVQSLMQRDAVERDKRELPEYGYASYAVQDIITQAKAVQRDASYYASHQKLRAIHLARYKLGELARGYVQGVGRLGGTPQWFADLGVPVPEPAK